MKTLMIKNFKNIEAKAYDHNMFNLVCPNYVPTLETGLGLDYAIIATEPGYNPP